MKLLVMASVLAISVAAIPMAFADEAATGADGSHHYVKDSVITAKVKSKLAAKPLTTVTSVGFPTGCPLWP